MNIFYHYCQEILSLLRSKTSKSISLIMSANLLGTIIGFICTVIVLRNLDNSSVALLYPLIGVMMIASQLSELGIATAFIKIASSCYETNRFQSLKMFHITIKSKVILSTITLIVGCILSPYISYLTFKTTDYYHYICLAIIASSCQSLTSYTNSSLQVEKRFTILSFIKTLPVMLKLLLLLILLLLNKLVFFYVLLIFFSVPVVTLLMGLFFATKEVLKVKSTFREDFGQIFKYSKWIFISSLAVGAIGQADILMVRSMAGVDQLSILVGGQKLANILPLITMALVTVLLPKVASMKGNRELNFYFRKSLLLIPLLLILLAIGLPTAKLLIPIVIGDKYYNSIIIFQIYFIGFCLGIFVTPLSLIIYHLNRENLLAVLNVAQLIINIVGNYLLIPHYGATGAALVSVAIRVLALLLVLFVLYKNGIIKYIEGSNENSV